MNLLLAVSPSFALGVKLRLRRFFEFFPPLLVALVVLTGFILGAAMFAPWSNILTALRSANPYWLLLAVVFNVAVFPLWILQWRLLSPRANRIAWRPLWDIVTLSSLANAAIASAVGVGSSLLLLITRGRLNAAQAASFIAMDQVLVGVAKLLVLLLAVILNPQLPEMLINGSTALATIILFVMAVLLVLSSFEIWATPKWTGSTGFGGSIGRLVYNLSEGLCVLRSPSRASTTLLLALAKKAAEVGAVLAVQLACGIEFSPAAAVLVVAVVGLTTIVPIVPGNIGIYSAAVYLVYDFLGVPPAIALAAAIVQHIVEIVPSLVIGYLTLFRSRSTEETKSNGGHESDY